MFSQLVTPLAERLSAAATYRGSDLVPWPEAAYFAVSQLVCNQGVSRHGADMAEPTCMIQADITTLADPRRHLPRTVLQLMPVRAKLGVSRMVIRRMPVNYR